MKPVKLHPPLTLYRKPLSIGTYTRFDSFSSSTNKSSIIHTFSYRCFWFCSYWTKLHLQLITFVDIFKKNDYPENFINNHFQIFLYNKHRIQERMITMPNKPLALVHLYLRPLSLQTTSKLRNSPISCKLQIVFKIQNEQSKVCYLPSFDANQERQKICNLSWKKVC